MLGALLRQSLERIPAEDRQAALDGELRNFQRLLGRLVGMVAQARREGAATINVHGLELVLAEALELMESCWSTRGYEPTGCLLAGLVAGLAREAEAGGERA